MIVTSFNYKQLQKQLIETGDYHIKFFIYMNSIHSIIIVEARCQGVVTYKSYTEILALFDYYIVRLLALLLVEIY